MRPCAVAASSMIDWVQAAVSAERPCVAQSKLRLFCRIQCCTCSFPASFPQAHNGGQDADRSPPPLGLGKR